MRSFAYLLQIATKEGTEIHPTAAVSNENTNNRAHDSESRTVRQSTPESRDYMYIPLRRRAVIILNTVPMISRQKQPEKPPKRVLITNKAVGSNNNTQSARILIFRGNQGKDSQRTQSSEEGSRG